MQQKQNSSKNTSNKHIPSQEENMEWLKNNLPKLDYAGILEKEQQRSKRQNLFKKVAATLTLIGLLIIAYIFINPKNQTPAFQQPYPYQEFMGDQDYFTDRSVFVAYTNGEYQTAQPLFDALLTAESNDYLQFLAATNAFYLGDNTTANRSFTALTKKDNFLLKDACIFYQALLLLPDYPKKATKILMELRNSQDRFVAEHALKTLNLLEN